MITEDVRPCYRAPVAVVSRATITDGNEDAGRHLSTPVERGESRG